MFISAWPFYLAAMIAAAMPISMLMADARDFAKEDSSGQAADHVATNVARPRPD